jgi:hypothetical protein
MPLKRTTTLPEFAELLGQPVTTVKRLFTAKILPEDLVTRTTGKHWRVSFSDEQLQHCKASLVLWSLWRRKPRASKTYPRRDELNATAIKLILAETKRGDAQDLKSPGVKYKAFAQAVLRLNTKRKRKRVEGVWWNEQILAKPTKSAAAAAFILRAAVAEFRSKHSRPPTRKQLSEALGISERSIYRFDKDALELAYQDRNLTGIKNEAKAESSTDPKQAEWNRIAQSDYAQQHQIRHRDHVEEGEKRKSRKRQAHSFALAWEEHSAGNVQGGALLVFPTSKIEAKRRLEMIEAEPTCGASGPRRSVKRHSRKLRRDLDLRERDPTFGSWAIAAYEIEPDGKWRWWTNFDASMGLAPSAAQARREIRAVIRRSRPRFRIVNLHEILGDPHH